MLLSATTRLLLAALLGAASAQYVAVVPPTLGGYGVPEYAAGGYYAAAVDPGAGAGLFPYPAAAYPQYAGPPPPPPPPPPSGPSAALPHQPYPYLLPHHLPIVYQQSSAGPLVPDGATQQVVVPVFAEQEEVDEDPVAAEEADDEQQVAHRSAVLRRTADYEDEEEEEKVEEEEEEQEQQQAARDEDEEAELEMSQPVLVAGDEAVVAEVPLVGVTETASGEKEASGYYVANDDGVEATVVVYPGPAPEEPLPFTVLSSGQTAVLKQKRQSEGRTEESDDAKPDSAADTAEVTAGNSSSTAAVASGTTAAGDAADGEEASSASDGASSAVDYACLGKNGLVCKPGYACVCERRADGGEAEEAVGNRRSPVMRKGPHLPSRRLTCLLVVDGRVFLNPQCRPPMPPRRRLLPLPTPQPATASASTSPRAGLDWDRRGTTSSSG